MKTVLVAAYVLMMVNSISNLPIDETTITTPETSTQQTTRKARGAVDDNAPYKPYYSNNNMNFYQQVSSNFQKQMSTPSPFLYTTDNNGNYGFINNNNNGYTNGNNGYNNGYNNGNNGYNNNRPTLPSYSKSFNPYINEPAGNIPVTPQNLWYSRYWADLTVPIAAVPDQNNILKMKPVVSKVLRIFG